MERGNALSKTAYSDLKAAWHTEAIAKMRRGEQIVPVQVQLIISDLCNQDCHFCAYRMSGGFSTEQFGEDTGKGFTMNPNRKIPTKKALEILDDCRALGVQGIQFTGGGEPTVHPEHMTIFAHALDLGMKCGLVSNGALLRNGWELVLPKFSWIRISVDADTEDTYSHIRNVSRSVYGRVIDNIRQLAHAIAASRSESLLGVGYVVTPENWRGLRDGVERIRDTGAAYVRLSAMFSKAYLEPFRDIHAQIREQIVAAKLLETDGFKVVDLFGDRIDDLRVHSPDYSFCGYQQFNCYIGGNLKVYRCCTTSYTRHGEVGDLNARRFADWFYSHEKKAAYGNFDARSCEVCQFNNKNRVIDYLVGENPLHVEFV